MSEKRSLSIESGSLDDLLAEELEGDAEFQKLWTASAVKRAIARTRAHAQAG